MNLKFLILKVRYINRKENLNNNLRELVYNNVIKFFRRFKTNPTAFGCDCSVYCIRIAASVFFTGRFNYFVFLGKHFQQRFQFFFIIRNSCFYIFTWKFCKFVNITVNKSMCNCRNMLRYLVMPHLIRYWLRKKWANSKI